MELRSFYFHHPQLFVVPVEHLTRRGMDAEYAEILAQERDLPPGFVELMNASVAAYCERLEHLFKNGRGTWFPPRLLNLCVVTDAERTRPYYQPFAGSSMLLYVSDFDPARSNVEFGTYQLVHAERLGITRSLPTTMLQNLGYFIVRSDEERRSFAEAARLSTRPDADAFVAMAEAMDWIGELHHERLRPPTDDAVSRSAVPGAGLLVTDEQAVRVRAVIDRVEAAAERVIADYYTAQAEPLGGPSAAQRIGGYLVERKPQVLLADRSGRIIWDPERADRVDGVEVSVDAMCDRAAQGICDDIELIATRSAQVFGRLANPDALPAHGEEVQQENGAYLHEARGMMVYSLLQPGLDTDREGSPPFHRWLLGARTAHEWGHLAAEADLVRVPPDKRAEHDAALEELIALLDSIIERAPEGFRKQVDQQFAGRPPGRSIGRAMVELQMQRIGDYKSNVFAREVLPTEEMESYVRANVRTLAAEPHSFLGKLARYAYEYQYLGFSKMKNPRHYFYESTWFPDNYIDTGIVTRAEADQMLDAMGRACACYELAEDALRPAPGA